MIRSARRTLSVAIDEGDVIVRAPMRMPKREIEAFLIQKRGWIERKICEQRERRRAASELMGEGRILLFGRAVVPTAGDRAITGESEIRKFYRSHLDYITGRVSEIAAAFGFAYGTLRFSNARTLWGTCDASNNIRLNWRLVAIPKGLIDYVIVHELAHTRQHNHSAAFWAEVERILPDWKKRRKALHEYGWLMNCYR